MLAVTLLSAVALLLAPAPGPALARSPALKVGVGRADITPPTGFDSFGFVRADGRIEGALSRLWARAIVIKSGKEKLALVSADLGGIPGGMLEQAIARVHGRGFRLDNVIVSASHTHSGPTGMFNFPTYNTVFMSANSPTDFQLEGSIDQQLYSFMVDRFARVLIRADRDLAPGRIGWGSGDLIGPTVNRSVEAHLRDHGIARGVGEGQASDDPDGAAHTLESAVDVLRVDRRLHGRWMPAGLWTNFANHGTVVKYQFRYYNGDHHASAIAYAEKRMRHRGRVPHGSRVLAVYGNGAEGDQSSGLTYDGPAGADEVGRMEGHAIIDAWRQAGSRLRRRAPIDTRWTRMCFCGQMTADGPVADQARFGLAQFTGSEEARGPLYDVTRVSFEGVTAPDTGSAQGTKVVAPLPTDVPEAVPLTVARVSDRLIATIPGEATKETGVRTRRALVEAARGAGVKGAVVSGLSNEFTSYYATAEEYDVQHYEGAATLHGRASAAAVEEVLADLAARLAAGRGNPKPYDYDQTNGVSPSDASFPDGAASAEPVAQPDARARRLGDPTFRWRGGPRGYDRPLDSAFIRVQHKMRHGKLRWKTIDRDNNSLRILWFVDDAGVYTARWEPSLTAPRGTYRFQIKARRYSLISDHFVLAPSTALRVEELDAAPGRVAVALRYPDAVSHEGIDDPPPDQGADLSYRPERATRGRVRFLVDGSPTVVRGDRGRFEVVAPAGARVEVPAGAAHDRSGNRNADAAVLRP